MTQLRRATSNSTSYPIFPLSSDPEFAFYLEEILSLANNGGANTGEVLRVATQIIPQDFESVHDSFYFMAEQIHEIAEHINIKKDPVGARDAYFRASSYYRAADFFLHGNWSDPRINSLWAQQRSSFDKALALVKPVPGQRFSIKAHSSTVGDFSVVGIFYKAEQSNAKKPTIIVGTGYDGNQESLYFSNVRQILARGMNVVTYEGPGQPTVRREQNVGFIPDWWNVVTPIVDWLEKRPDVDSCKIALEGISFGGILAPVAASRDHRISAVIANDGFANFTSDLLNALPSFIVELYESGNKTRFDQTMLAIAANSSYPSNLRWLIDQSLWSFNTESAYEWFTRLSGFAMTAETVRDLPMPVFVAKGEDDTLTGNQADIAYQLLSTERPNGKHLTTFYEFKTALGAGEHCALGAESQFAQVTLDWLGDVWGLAFSDNGY